MYDVMSKHFRNTTRRIRFHTGKLYLEKTTVSSRFAVFDDGQLRNAKIALTKRRPTRINEITYGVRENEPVRESLGFLRRFNGENNLKRVYARGRIVFFAHARVYEISENTVDVRRKKKLVHSTDTPIKTIF